MIIGILAQALKELFNSEHVPIETIGIRHGEKMYETLVTAEEMLKAQDLGINIELRRIIGN